MAEFLLTYILASGIRCRLCQRARNREECQGFAECADDEVNSLSRDKHNNIVNL